MFTKGKHRRSPSIYLNGVTIHTEEVVKLRALREFDTLGCKLLRKAHKSIEKN